MANFSPSSRIRQTGPLKMVRVLLRSYSTTVFIIAVFVHVGTFLDWPGPLPFATLFLLQAAAMAAFAALVFALNERKDADKLPVSGTFLNSMTQEQARAQRVFANALAEIPLGVKVLAGAMLVYCFVNFFLCMELTSEGQTRMSDSGPLLEYHGEFVRSLTPDEYWQFASYETRGWSGHCIIFSMIPAVYFWFVSAKQEQRVSAVRS